MKWSCLLLVLSMFSCHHLTKKPSESDAAGVYYQVQKGDTLQTVAQEQLSTEEEIAEVNGITAGLRVGQWLFVPENDAIGMRIRMVKRNIKRPVAQKTAVATKVPKKPDEPKPKALAKTKKSFLFPVKGGIVFKEFSLDKKKPYEGIGIRASLGSAIKSSGDGEVLYVGNDGTSYGLMVIIEHEEPYISVYTHLDKALVKNKSQVKEGEVIGQVGRSGGAKFPQLHFQLRVKERPVNPRPYFKMDG